jgi:hypothetical protein
MLVAKARPCFAGEWLDRYDINGPQVSAKKERFLNGEETLRSLVGAPASMYPNPSAKCGSPGPYLD